MRYYLLKSEFRLAIAGLIVGTAGLWYFWYATDQIMSIEPLIYTSGIVILNIALAFFSYNRQFYTTRFIFVSTYFILLLIAYGLYTLTRSIR